MWPPDRVLGRRRCRQVQLNQGQWRMSSGHFPIERSRWSPLRDTIRAVRWGNALFCVPPHGVDRRGAVRLIAS